MRLSLIVAFLASLMLSGGALAEIEVPQTPEELEEAYAEFLSDCISPYEKAKDEAFEVYEEALYSGKMGQADHAKRNLEIFAALNDAEAAHKSAKSKCRIEGMEWLDDIERKLVEASLRDIEQFLQDLIETLEPVQCIADGSIIECRDATGEIIPIPDGVRM